MQFNSTGGIFLRLDTSGNLNIYDSAGNSVAKFIGGVFSSKLNKGTQVTNAIITSTVSTSPVAVGVSNNITPQISGNVLLIATCDLCSNGTAGDGINLQVNQVTGTTNQAGGAAAAGGAVRGIAWTSVTAGAGNAIELVALVTGLTPGTAYTFELEAAAVTGGTASFTGAKSIIVYEV